MDNPRDGSRSRNHGSRTLAEGVRDQRGCRPESLRTCGDTLAEGFEFRDDPGRGVSDAVVRYGMSPIRRWFLGLLNGKAASVSLLALHDEFAGIYCVATIPEARGKGLGRAITREPLLAAKSEGYKVAVLEASSMGLPVYKGIGFNNSASSGHTCGALKRAAD